MKKLLIALYSLLYLSMASAFAGTISIQPFISGNDVTIGHLESQRQTIQNFANGGVEGGINIKAGSLVSQDFSNSVSIVKFRDESFNDFTFSGMLPVTSGTLTSNISAGISYVNGVRIETNATSHTYTASKDTYVYINYGGFFDFQEVANGAAAPSTPTNDLLLAKVVSSGTALTSVTDLRTLSIQITANSSNFAMDYRSDAYISYDSTTAMHVEPGQVAIGNTNYTNTADTSSKSTATGTNWIEGAVPPLANQKVYVYAFNNSGSGFDFKYASADPVYSDTSLNTAGTLRYYSNSGIFYRAIGYVSMDSAGTITSNAESDLPDTNHRNFVYKSTGAMTTTAATIPYDNTPPLSTEGAQVLEATIKPTNANNKIRVTAILYLANDTTVVYTAALFQGTGTSAVAVGNASGSAVNNLACITINYVTTALSTNPVTFRLRGGAASGTTTFNGDSGAARFAGLLSSSITLEEIPG